MLNVKPHAVFKRSGADLYLEIPISFDRRQHSGAEIVVPTLEGKVSYKVPAGTQPGSSFPLERKRCEILEKRIEGADLYVKVNLEVPTKLNHKQKKAIEDMGKVVTEECYQKKHGFKEKLKDFFS